MTSFVPLYKKASGISPRSKTDPYTAFRPRKTGAMGYRHQQRKLVAIAPALDEDGSIAVDPDGRHDGPSDAPASKTKRTTTLVACDECRRRRVKCDGQRPGCGQCTRKSDECVYAAAEGETLVVSLQKKHDLLQGEHSKYKELLTLLRTQPEEEARQILRRIRETDEPLLVIEEIRRVERLVAEPWPAAERLPPDDDLLRLDQEAGDDGGFADLWTFVADHDDDDLMSKLTAEYFV